MPKTFSGAERAYITKRLMEETEKCLALYGIRKTTVDELVKRVNIPKGTFYLFYESKEQLIFDVILRFHDGIQQQMLSGVAALREAMDREKLTDLLFGLYKKLQDSFMPRLMSDGELGYFMGKLPPELSQLHTQRDDLRFEELISLIPNVKVTDKRVLSAAMRGIFLSLLFRKELGEDVFDDALRVMIRGVVLQMFEGGAL